MKILMRNRGDCFIRPGGDTIQMMETKKWIERLGAQVDISLGVEEINDHYDIVHVFNVQKGVVENTLRQVIQAKRKALPIALSTIYWSWTIPEDVEYKTFLGEKRRRSLKGTVRKIIKEVLDVEIMPARELEQRYRRYVYHNSFLERIRQCVLLSDVLLPNAKGELDRLSADLEVPSRQLHAHIVPNGIDPSWVTSTQNPEAFRSKHNLNEFVLCVGRMEPSKNQHVLIRALRETGIPIVFIGGNDTDYGSYCMKIALKSKGAVLFLDQMPHEELIHAYAAARVHILPSWRETPGLASLEAGALGCNIVVTPNGTTREYFGNYAWYCSPDDIESIRNAVLKAYGAERHSELKEHIRKYYTWKKAAEMTLEAYRCAISHYNKSDCDMAFLPGGFGEYERIEGRDRLRESLNQKDSRPY